MTRNFLILLATLGSAAALAGAFAFQFIGGLAPCHLCLLQRYPHGAAIAIGVLYMKGLNPGPTLFTERASSMYALYLIFIIANISKINSHCSEAFTSTRPLRNSIWSIISHSSSIQINNTFSKVVVTNILFLIYTNNMFSNTFRPLEFI